MKDKIRYIQVHSGWVLHEETMGGDQVIIDAARTCSGIVRAEAIVESMDLESNKTLIERLLKGKIKHNTPIEHCVFRFRVRCPIFVARQWLRHRIGTFNERSLRRCSAKTDYFTPGVPRLSEEKLNNGIEIYEGAMQEGLASYEYLIEKCGWPKEIARGVVGTAIYTEFLWTVNAWSLINWLTKRLDKAAQYEHREYAQAILRIFETEVPILAGAFKKYILDNDED